MFFDKHLSKDGNDQSKNVSSIPLFLNKPIDKESDDAVGLLSDAEMLSNAIDKKADMIAVSSPFGSGKSSVIELFKNIRKNTHNERILTISMWPQLTNNGDEIKTNELHKHLTYQIIKAIDSRIGSYINRRNSSYFKLIKAYSNHKYTFLFIAFAIFFWILSDTKQIENLLDIAFHPYPSWVISLISIIAKVMTAIICIVVLIRTEIVVTNPKLDEKREIEEDEIIDVFREEVLKKRICRKKCITYIVVIEDLDRCDYHDAVYQFLKELRKYYIPDDTLQGKKRDRIVFIVNIKPEGMLMLGQDNRDYDPQYSRTDIYEKLFDYILDLQTVHTDDYKPVFNDILKPYAKELCDMGICPDDNSKSLTDIHGMQWIIHGKKLGIREIKHRLNRAIMIYYSLKKRFPDQQDNISFEKCAVVSYLTTAFENDFWKTDDNAFGKLVSIQIKQDITKVECKKVLEESAEDISDEYVNEVWELIKTRLIDSDYKMYLYNCPKGSKVNTYDESLMRNAILYDENSDEINDIIDRVIHKFAVKEALEERINLGKMLPKLIFDYDSLYCECLRLQKKETIQAMDFWIKELGEDTESIINKLIGVLHFDSLRQYYKKDVAQVYVEIWNEKFEEVDILKLRKKICVEFPTEADWYKGLFFASHALISLEERDLLTYNQIIHLFNIHNENCTMDDIEDLVERYIYESDSSGMHETISILKESTTKFDSTLLAALFVKFMVKSNIIESELEKVIIDSLGEKPEKASGFTEYQALINQIANNEQQLNQQTLQFISDSKYYNNYTIEVSDQLYENNYRLDSLLMKIINNYPVDFDNQVNNNTIQKNIKILSEHDCFSKLRIRIVKECNNIMSYRFMFSKDLPFMTQEELEIAREKVIIDDLIDLWPVSNITQINCDYLLNYWNSKYRLNSIAESILCFIAQLEPSLTQYCFDRLDFNGAIKYYSFSSDRKRNVKKVLDENLGLSKTSKMLEYIKTTHFMDEEWLNEAQADIIGNQNMEKLFAESLLDCKDFSIREISIETIVHCQYYRAYNENIEQQLLRKKQYKKYVASKILRVKKIDVRNISTSSDLWKAYVSLYTECKYEIFTIMSNDAIFIKTLMNEGLYNGLDEKHRKPFTTVKQTTDCLADLIQNYDEEFVTMYLSSIIGFSDIETEMKFIELMKNNEVYLLNDGIYRNIHSKLSSKSLKAQYTLLRKRKRK